MPMNVKALLNWTFEDVVQHYSERDTMLYALGLNFGSDPTDERELAFVYEADLVAVPSMAVVLGHPGFWARDPRFGIDWKRVLHGEQWLQVFRQLPARGHVIGRTRIEQISDKGAQKGAVIYSSRDIIDADSGDVLARASMSTFARGDGGFGGESLAGPPVASTPERAPDHVCDLDTLPQQALIYRLNGDYNPLHADPGIARAAGFERPILHGLATYGLAARAVLRTLCDYDPRRLVGLDVRFSAPVYPGETVRFSMWRDEREARFEATVPGRDVVVLKNGTARLA